MDKLFSDNIFMRGREYYLEGRVSDVVIFDDKVIAMVNGSIPYRVEIKYADSEVKSMQCTCPYAQSNNCKHMASLLVYLHELKIQKISENIIEDIPNIRREFLEEFLVKMLHEHNHIVLDFMDFIKMKKMN